MNYNYGNGAFGAGSTGSGAESGFQQWGDYRDILDAVYRNAGISRGSASSSSGRGGTTVIHRPIGSGSGNGFSFSEGDSGSLERLRGLFTSRGGGGRGNTPQAPLDMSQFNRGVSGMDQLGMSMFDMTPEAAYEYFLQNVHTSAVQERLLRQMYNSLQNRWMAAIASNPQQNGDLNFLEFLRGINIPYEFAQVAPSARGEQSQRFVAPARVMSF